jgi:hypothetical protein
MKRTSYVSFRMFRCGITTLGNIPTSYKSVCVNQCRECTDIGIWREINLWIHQTLNNCFYEREYINSHPHILIILLKPNFQYLTFLMYELCHLAFLRIFDVYISHLHVPMCKSLKGTTPDHSATYEGYLYLHTYQSPSAQAIYIIA